MTGLGNTRRPFCLCPEFALRSLEELQEAVDVCMTCRKCEHCVKSLLNDAGECDGSTWGS